MVGAVVAESQAWEICRDFSHVIPGQVREPFVEVNRFSRKKAVHRMIQLGAVICRMLGAAIEAAGIMVQGEALKKLLLPFASHDVSHLVTPVHAARQGNRVEKHARFQAPSGQDRSGMYRYVTVAVVECQGGKPDGELLANEFFQGHETKKSRQVCNMPVQHFRLDIVYGPMRGFPGIRGNGVVQQDDPARISEPGKLSMLFPIHVCRVGYCNGCRLILGYSDVLRVAALDGTCPIPVCKKHWQVHNASQSAILQAAP